MSLNVFIINGSNRPTSATKTVALEVSRRLERSGSAVDVLDLHQTPLPMFDPESTPSAAYYAPLRARALRADVFVLGSPDYHGSISGPMKNFVDHFWTEFAGTLFATVVASNEKGLTVHDQLRTIARQCYAWTMPYGLSLSGRVEVEDGRVTSDALERRLSMFVRDVQVYGRLLATQRAADLDGDDPGFLAQYRS